MTASRRHLIRGILLGVTASLLILLGTATWMLNRQPSSQTLAAPRVTNNPALKQRAFQPPTLVQAIALAGVGAASMSYFPSDVADVTKKVFKWLQTATPTSVTLPPVQKELVFNAYIGPAQLVFSDENGHRITLFPTYYIAHTVRNGLAGYSPNYFKDVITYQDGEKVIYLRSPELFSWLEEDRWKSEFEMEMCDDAQKNAISAVLKSKWGAYFRTSFPHTPGVNAIQIPRGGERSADGKMTPLKGTCTTQAQEVGKNVRVTFTEEWNNGKRSHKWTFVVSPKGSILSHTQSGDTAPQDWQ
jgi:hypothetical protein